MTLKTKAISGVKWNGILMFVITVLQFITIAVLARILNPSDFGIMGMIMVIIGFGQAFADMGLSNAIIYRQDVTGNQLSSFFWLNIFIGVLICIGIFIIKPIAATYFKQPDLSTYLLLASVIFLITPFGQIFTTLLKKELQFKKLAQVEIISIIIYSFSAIGLAIAGFGVLSLIFGQIIRSALRAILLIINFKKIWLPKVYFNFSEIESYFSFGAFQMGERIVNYVSSRMDFIIIGGMLGVVELGYYNLAYQIMIFPSMKMNPILTRVAFPTFSKIQNDNNLLRRGYSKILNYLSLVNFPIMIGIFVIAPEFVRIFLGPKWTESIIILQILCLVGILRSLGNPVGSILLAKGKANIGFFWNIFVIFIVGFSIRLGVNWGIVGVAMARLISQGPLLLLSQHIVNRLIEFDFTAYFNSIKYALLSSFFMLLGMTIYKTLLNNQFNLTYFIIVIPLGLLIYSFTYYLWNRSVYNEIKNILIGKSS